MKRDIPTPRFGTGNEPAAFLPPPPSRAKRNRNWEASQRSGDFVQVSYRHLPRDLRDAVTDIAQTRCVTSDEVARAFLEFALQAYQDGRLTLMPKLKTGRLTLFGENDQ
ncbi:MAG: hypothetical protein EHM48_00695 [Planctomycetaceae bacterium]|nr:MAG: hypothetical protein EHM48_00695 [Planctomycetaceae bacterium]